MSDDSLNKTLEIDESMKILCLAVFLLTGFRGD